MKKQVVVIGLGRLGESLAKTLTNIGHEVLAIDFDENLVQKIAPFVTQAVQVDFTDESALRELGVGNFDIGIVTIPEIEKNVLSTLILKKVGVRFVIGRAISEAHGTILERIGADKVVYPERDMGTGLAYVLTLGNIIDYIPVTAEYGVVKMSVPNKMAGKSLSEAGFGHHGMWEVIVLVLQRKQDILLSPGGAEIIKPEDVLVVSGTWDKLEQLFTQMQRLPEK
jgi:trk system potassium uptake protein TrkA